MSKFNKLGKFKSSKIRREGIRKGIYILPNLFTTACLFCGFFSIVQSLKGNFRLAAWSIFAAGVFDLLDGRIARWTHASSDFGTEYDSLCDLASFGLAPVILAFTWSLIEYNRIGLAAGFLFFACGAMRLARYNVQSSNVEKTNFQGLPIPMAAGLIITYVIFYHNIYGSVLPGKSLVLLLLTIAGALLMVSNVPYQSFKKFASKRRASFFYLVGLAVVLFFFIISPHEFVFVACMAYAVSGIVEYLVRLFLQVRNVRSINQTDILSLGGSQPPSTSTKEHLKVIH